MSLAAASGLAPVTASPDDGLDARLLNDFQRDFPLVARPFAELARQLGCDEARVCERLRFLQLAGAVSRVGPVFAPCRFGASTLAALRVPEARLEQVAGCVSRYEAVNHNYAREHEWNLWFVAAAADAQALGRTLAGIERETACPLIALPLQAEYHIDLGFDLASGRRAAGPARPSPPSRRPLGPEDQALVAAVQHGIALLGRPFAEIADRLGTCEDRVLQRLRGWLAEGMVKRFGVIVRHHELGWRANAMCVWDVPDGQADEFGARLAACEGVHLCYRRQRAAGRWPYNLYCMIHGRDRDEVHARLERIESGCGLDRQPGEVLFSTRRFKQCGARYTTGAAHV